VTTEFLLDRVERTEPKTIRQFVTSVRDQMDELEGYPEFREYVNEQADELGVSVGGTGGDALGDLLDLSDGGDEGDGGTEGGEGPGDSDPAGGADR